MRPGARARGRLIGLQKTSMVKESLVIEINDGTFR